MFQKQLLKKLSLLALIISLLLPASALAFTIKTSEDADIMITEQINDDLYSASPKEIRVTSGLNGDLLSISDYLGVSGELAGDILSLSLSGSKIDGNVSDDIRLASLETIEINGKINGDALLLAKKVIITPEAEIRGQLLVFAEELELAGKVYGKTNISVNIFNFYGEIAGDAHLAYNGATLVSSTEPKVKGKISGNLFYAGPFSEDQIREKITATNYQVETTKVTTPGTIKHQANNGFSLGKIIFSIVINITLGLVFILLTPRMLPNIANQSYNKSLKSIAIGAAILLGSLPLVLMIMISVVGFKISLLAISKYLGLILIMKVVAAFNIGYIIFKKPEKSTKTEKLGILAVGLLAVELVSLIPFVGTLLLITVYAWAVGGLTLYGNEIYKTLLQNKAI